MNKNQIGEAKLREVSELLTFEAQMKKELQEKQKQPDVEAEVAIDVDKTPVAAKKRITVRNTFRVVVEVWQFLRLKQPKKSI